MDFGECGETINYSIILITDLEGKSSKIYFENDLGINLEKVQVDQCLEIEGKRCDWLIIINDPFIEIYIELKGCRVDDGLKQIENTIKQISQHKKKTTKVCYIIHQRCPLTSPEIQKKQKYFIEQYNARLLIKKSGYHEKLSKLITN